MADAPRHCPRRSCSRRRARPFFDCAGTCSASAWRARRGRGEGEEAGRGRSARPCRVLSALLFQGTQPADAPFLALYQGSSTAAANVRVCGRLCQYLFGGRANEGHKKGCGVVGRIALLFSLMSVPHIHTWLSLGHVSPRACRSDAWLSRSLPVSSCRRSHGVALHSPSFIQLVLLYLSLSLFLSPAVCARSSSRAGNGGAGGGRGAYGVPQRHRQRGRGRACAPVAQPSTAACVPLAWLSSLRCTPSLSSAPSTRADDRPRRRNARHPGRCAEEEGTERKGEKPPPATWLTPPIPRPLSFYIRNGRA